MEPIPAPRRRPRRGSAAAALACTALLAAPAVATAGPGEREAPSRSPAESDDWSVTLGLGAGVAPSYEGSESYEFVPLPVVDLRWRDRAFVGTGGVGVDLFRSEHLRLGARLGYNGGRDEDDDDALDGLGDVDAAVEAGIFGALSYGAVSLSADLRQDIADGHEGLLGRAALTYRAALGEDLAGTLGPSVTWADDAYMESFFGVDADQSAASGLPRFDAGSGIKSYALAGSLRYALTTDWAVTAIARYARLAGDAADSPIVQDEDQFFSGVTIAYRFR